MLLKLLHRFTQARQLAAQSAVHLPTASHVWKDGSSRVTIQRVRLTASPTAFLNETDLTPPCWVGPFPWFILKDQHNYAHTAFLHTKERKIRTVSWDYSLKKVQKHSFWLCLVCPRHTPQAQCQGVEWGACKHSRAGRCSWLPVLFPLELLHFV